MKPTRLLAFLVCALLFHYALQCRATVSEVSENEQEQWLRYLIPLPKQISITHKVELPVSEIKITLREGAGDTEKAALNELLDLFGLQDEKGNVETRFEIRLGVCDTHGKIGDVTISGADELAGLPNREQAYLIRPAGENRLVLSALDERGVYYAAQTLRQLIESRLTGGRVAIPLVTVTDWPDMSERGVWGHAKTNSELKWMSALKLNLIQYPVSLEMTKGGRGTAGGISPNWIESAHRHAVRTVAFMALDSLDQAGAYEMIPELRSKALSTRTHPCASQSRFTGLLAEFMRSIAAQGITEISACLSEEYSRCSCEECRNERQSVMETRALVKAWHAAREQYPDLKLRVLLTQGSYLDNDKVLAEVPEEAGVTYYQTYTASALSREPMIYPLLEQYAAKDRWLGVFLPTAPSDTAMSPWTEPQFIKSRMREFVRKKLQCVCGPVLDNLKAYDFNDTAAAEWSWNSGQRSEREFAAAWATRRAIGLKDPSPETRAAADAAAEWAAEIGPVEWDIYGSRIPDFHFRRAAGSVASSPALWRRMFRYLPTVEHVDRDLKKCDDAMAIAQRLAWPAFEAETRIIQGYLRIVKEIYSLADQLSAVKKPAQAEREELQDKATRLTLAGLQTGTALEKWQTSINTADPPAGFFTTVNMIDQIVSAITDALVPLGIRTSATPYIRREVGSWRDNDFEAEERIAKTWNITSHLPAGGIWKLRFNQLWGPRLFISRVALASAPADNPDQLTELSVDEHEDTTGDGGKGCVYTVTLDRRDPHLQYFILADMQNPRRGAGPYGASGTVLMWAQKPKDWIPGSDTAELRSLTDEELEIRRSRVPEFADDRLRVAVASKAWGTDCILDYLRDLKGIDAQPLPDINRLALAPCQVVVLPQLKLFPGSAAVETLENYVREGGGLITTHDAVGYRDHPLLITRVCARGAAHVKDTQWVVIKEHPVTAGIEMNKPLTNAYYDHVELECGPEGTVLANAAKSGKPVVIAGALGKGRYVACGMIIGIDSENKEVELTGAERTLLENAVKWCGGLPP